MANENSYVSMNIRAGKIYKKGCLSSTVIIDGKYSIQMDANVNVHGFDIAYEMADFWCKEKAKELDIVYRVKAKHDIRKRLDVTLAKRDGIEIDDYSELAPFKDMRSMRKLMQYAYEEVGYDRLKLVMGKGLEHVEELKVEKLQSEKRVNDANKELAMSLIRIQKDTGVDISAMVNNDEVMALYNELA